MSPFPLSPPPDVFAKDLAHNALVTQRVEQEAEEFDDISELDLTYIVKMTAKTLVGQKSDVDSSG